MSVRLIRDIAVLSLIAAACGESVETGRNVDDLPRFVVEEELRIGSVDDPDVGFSSIGAVAVGDDGLVHVLDRQEMAVRIYDDSGTILTKLGAAGEGPGEFRMPVGIGLIGDTIWVHDLRLRRTSLFTRDGFVRALPMPTSQLTIPGLVGAQLIASGLRSDGLFDTSFMIPVMREMPTDSFWMPHARMDTSGAIVDTIQMQRYGFVNRATIDAGGAQLTVPSGPSDHPLWLDAGDEAFVIERPVATSADAGEFTVTRIAGIADTLFTDTFTYTPRQFTAADTDSVIARAVAPYRNRPGMDADAVMAAFRNAFSPPAFHPPIAAGRIGADGMLWLRRQDTGDPNAEWLVLTADGAPYGIVTLPRAATVQWSAGTTLWTAVPDELDVPWLVKHRMRPES
jgi:hypothetical protein